MKQQIDFSALRRVLVIKLRHHGDVLLTSPVFSLLKGRHAHLEIDALVYRETEPMLSLHPAIHEIHCIDKQWKLAGRGSLLRHELELMNRLKARRYDLIIHLTESWRGAILCRYLRPRHAIALRYPTRETRLWRGSFSHHYSSPAGNRRHTVERHLDALRHLGLIPNEAEKHLTLVAGQGAENALQEKLGKLSPPWIVIHPTSRWLFKCWSEARMAETINALAVGGRQVILTAGPEHHEMAMVERILTGVDQPIINLAGQLELKELAAVIERASLFIGVDSLPMHMASASQTPTVALFGPSGEIEWGPWKNRAAVITSSHPCRPCGQDGCGNSKISECLTSLESRQVIDAAESLLDE